MGTRVELGHLACAALVLAVSACASAVPPPPAAPARTEAPAKIEAPAEPFEYRLPVDGTWIVSQGYHGAESHQGRAAYALDLVKLDDGGRAYTGHGKRLDDWYSFGAEVLASADGVVVRANDRFPDNRVWGKRKTTNSVIVRHGDVYSEYVHLQHGSLRVREGEQVKRGQLLALAGNSGAETPHLHWALLSSIEPIRTRPAALACEARDANGEWTAVSGAPSSGATIRPRSSAR